MRAIPDRAFSLVRDFEGVRLSAYHDVADIWTVGYGHTGPEVHKGLAITPGQADAYLRSDLARAAGKLEKVLREEILLRLTDNQYAALLSFSFNLGVDPSWGIWALINSGDFDRVPSRMQLYNKARVGGQLVKVAGLTRRRQAEGALWEEGQGEEIVLTASKADTPPTPMDKPVSQSKTLWTGAGVAASGIVAAGQQIQALAAPQAEHSELVAHLASGAAVLVVGGGLAIVAFRWLDARHRRS